MKTLLRSHDLTCPTCVARLEQALGAVEGVERARVHFTPGRIEVEHDPTRIGADDLVKVVRASGYEAKVSAL